MKSGLSACIFLYPLFFFAVGCSDNEAPLPEIDEQFNGFESFAVAEVLAKNCALPECHRGETSQNGLSFESYQLMIKGSAGRHFGAHDHGKSGLKTAHETPYGGSPVIPFDADNSLLYNLITGNIVNSQLRMPYMGEPLSEPGINILKDWINNGARDFNGNVPYSGSKKVFVCNQGSDEIYIIDTDYMVVSGIINVDINPAAIDQPHNIVSAGNYCYVTLISAGQFLKIDISTNQIAGRVTGLEVPGMIAITSDGKTAYVSKSSTASPVYNEIYIIDTETMIKTESISVPVGLPHSIQLSADGGTLYVADMNKDRIYYINTATKEIEDQIVLSNTTPATHEPMHIYLSPAEDFLFVNCRTSSELMIIDPGTKQILQEIPVKPHPMQAAISPDGNKIYVVSHHEPVLSVIERNGTEWTKAEIENQDAFHHLYGADLSADGKYLFLTCSNAEDDYNPPYEIPDRQRPSLLCIFDTQSEEIIKVLDIGSYATGIAAR